MKNRVLVAALTIGTLLLCAVDRPNASPGQETRGLRLDFKPRSLNFHVQVSDLASAYEVTPSGDIQMLPDPDVRVVTEENVRVEVAKAKQDLGRITVHAGDQNGEILVRGDNSLGGSEILTGLPFGYNFLPASGRAAPGDSWTQEIPAPPQGELAAHITYRYTFKGPKATTNCADCVEIAILGLRRFRATGATLDSIRSDKSADFYLELDANVSVLTFFALPGVMRRSVLEATSGGDQ